MWRRRRSAALHFLSMVTSRAGPDITQLNLACIPKACLLVCAKTLSTVVLSDRAAALPCAASRPHT